MSLRLKDAEWLPTPHTFGRISPTLMVIHESGTRIGPGECAKYCRAPKRTNKVCVGYHVVIERSGKVQQLAEFNRKIRHAGISKWKGRKYANQFAIGIALVGPTELEGNLKRAKSFYGRWFRDEAGLNDEGSAYHGHNHIWLNYTREQLIALQEVIDEIRGTYPGMPIAPHWYVSPGRKIDPAPELGRTLVDYELLSQRIDYPVPNDATPAQELAHAAEQADEAPAVACAPSTDKTLKAQSREYNAANVMEKVAAGGVAGTVVTKTIEMIPADASDGLAYLQTIKSTMDLVGSMMASYGLVIILLVCLGVFGGSWLIKHWKRQSYDAGLYEPSGETEEPE